MAHYIAEKMIIVEAASDADKEEASENCFRAILTLWQHHASFPNNKPYKNFEGIFRALNSLDPENNYPRYFQDPDVNVELDERTQNYMNLAKGLDSAAKVVISTMLEAALRGACDDSVRAWLSAEIEKLQTNESKVVFEFVSSDQEEQQDIAGKELEKLRSRLKKLEVFDSVAREVRGSLREQIKRIEKEGSW